MSANQHRECAEVRKQVDFEPVQYVFGSLRLALLQVCSVPVSRNLFERILGNGFGAARDIVPRLPRINASCQKFAGAVAFRPCIA
nr:hypothetical protein [Massilia eurypsychrophila]